MSEKTYISSSTHRLADILMVGHGTALLLIFNARIDDPSLATADLKGAAWWFAIGLFSAFLVAYLRFQHDAVYEAPLRLLETAQKRAQEQSDRQTWLSRAFVVSAALFLIGLFNALDMLNITAPVGDTPAVEQDPIAATGGVDARTGE